MSKTTEILLSSILAGICISIGCMAFIVNGGIIGATLFAFGLATVVHYQLKLYTGTAGFFKFPSELIMLFLILFGNVIGCGIMAFFTTQTLPEITAGAVVILAKRLSLGLGALLFLSALCGFIMTTAVNFGRQKAFIPLLLGVPLFITTGFLHSIADAYYYLTALFVEPGLALSTLGIWVCIVIGNFIGCNFYRWLMRQ